MAPQITEATPFHWLLPTCAGFLALATSVSIALCQADVALFLYLLFGLILIVLSIALLAFMAFRKSRRARLTLLSTLLVVWVIAVAVFVYHPQIRTTARWLAWSRTYKDRVLAQQAPANGEFRHVDWDSWGWGGEDTTVYLVFDPANSLSLPASHRQSGKFDGIPCAVPEVHRLENQWYTVLFYTNQYWDHCK